MYAEQKYDAKTLTITGNPGHGSQFIKNTAAEKVQFIINKLLGFREEQKAIFESDPDIKLGDVTTVNLTYMSGGIQVSPLVVSKGRFIRKQK